MDVVLPCVKCLAIGQGLRADQWREATLEMSGDDLHWAMEKKLRQHFARKHRLLARDPEAQAMRQQGALLLCSVLHAKENPDQV